MSYQELKNNMKQQLEEVIERNLPEERTEKKNHTPNCLRGTDKYNHAYCEISVEDDGFNQAISSIDTSLIADEVLKVVVEIINQVPTEFPQYESNDMHVGAQKFKTILLSTLSPNKENKNNE